MTTRCRQGKRRQPPVSSPTAAQVNRAADHIGIDRTWLLRERHPLLSTGCATTSLEETTPVTPIQFT
jgi:hypothetical protein